MIRRNWEMIREFKILSKRKNTYCFWCKCRISIGKAIADHIQPLSWGGIDEKNNLVYSCKKCDEIRGIFASLRQTMKRAYKERLIHTPFVKKWLTRLSENRQHMHTFKLRYYQLLTGVPLHACLFEIDVLLHVEKEIRNALPS